MAHINIIIFLSIFNTEYYKMSNGKKVGVVGSGLVGKSWAMIFASQGYEVAIIIHNKIIVKSSQPPL